MTGGYAMRTTRRWSGVRSRHGLGAGELARLRDAIDLIDEGFQVLSHDWRYLYVNTAAARHSRRAREDLVGRTVQECFPGIERTELFERLAYCMCEREAVLAETEFAGPDGTMRWYELHVAPCPEGITVLFSDITARKQMEAHLRHVQKLEATGRLAGAIAHDFNNMLSVILTYIHVMLEERKEVDPAGVELAEINKAGQRAAELTKQLLAFIRSEPAEPRIVDVNAVLADSEKMIARLVGEDIATKLVLQPDLGCVKADPGHIVQVLVNLAVNARDAMPRGGALTIETDNASLDAEYARAHPEVRPGPHVVLVVSDTGCGMDRPTLDRMFEPFFTTKETGKGTGLGLATVYGIVKDAGGSIYVYSEVGRGTTFKIYLPQVRESAVEPVQRTSATAMRGSGTVLLVEDDAQLRALAKGILERAGYRVLEAQGGTEAIRRCESEPGPIHLLLTDVVMPGMSGKELSNYLVRMRPDMKVLYTSGYTEDAIAQHGILGGGVAFLQKPITPVPLLGKVAEVLGTHDVR